MVTVFGDVIGHGRALELLAREAAGPAQAYLFVGPTGVGKATVARRFAAALLCPERGAHDVPCRSCRRAVEGGHPDLVIVEPDGLTSLSVDRARTTVARATLAPVEGERKVFLFEEADSMTEQAANALLKTLEEPTATTVFLLVAESEEALPSTVASRSRTVHLGRVAEEELAESLERRGVPQEQAREAARVSGGRPGLATALATRPEMAAFRRAWLGVPLRVTGRPGEAILLAEEVLGAAKPLLEELQDRQEVAGPEAEDSGRSARERRQREERRASKALLTTGLEILASWYRDAAAAQFGAPVRNRDVPSKALAALPAAAAVARAGWVLESVAAVEANQRPQLVLSALFARLGAPD